VKILRSRFARATHGEGTTVVVGGAAGGVNGDGPYWYPGGGGPSTE
jgi:hypothetical protein